MAPFDPRQALRRARAAASLATDLATLNTVRRAVLPLPVIDRRAAAATDVFPPLAYRRVAALDGARVAVVASAGGAPCVALVGMARALEEAGIVPVAICACSSSAPWAAMWAAGLSAQEMAEFSLSWQPEDYLDIQWASMPRFALSALRGFTGLAKGEALERLLERRLWHMSAAETEIQLHMPAFNIDRGRLEWFGSTETPDLTLGELVRVAAARPLLVEAVRVEDALYVDGGVVDPFPAEPLVADGSFDRVIALNVALPPGLEGEDIGGWDRRSGGILDARRQLRHAHRLELAQRARRRLGDRLTLVEPVRYGEPRPPAFYELFIDRREWPHLMRRGYETTVHALEQLRKEIGPAAEKRGRPRSRPKRPARRGRTPTETGTP